MAAKPVRRRKRKLTPHQQILADNRHLYQDILDSQQGHCALCPATPKPNRKLDLDHDHKRMVIRGLLCHRCNRGLSYWMTEAWLLKAAAYIDRTYTPTEPSEEPDGIQSPPNPTPRRNPH